MEFGMQFFPSMGPDERPADAYFRESLDLVGLCDELGYNHVRIVEHYFHRYGGYSPNPMVFLSAASQRTRTARLVTGALLPIFNNPLKVAGEIGMLDAISGGRLEVGVARAFLPHEFAHFGISLDQSRARFNEGLAQILMLLEHDQASHHGDFHQFKNVTSLPRPTQTPRPPVWIAALATPQSFEGAGKAGHSVMAIPLTAFKMKELLDIYRAAWRAAGHPGDGRVMLAFHMFCWPDGDAARELARGPITGYMNSLVEAASAWTEGASSADYPGYDKIIETLKADTFEANVERGASLVGTPAQITKQLEDFRDQAGAWEWSSLQVNFHGLPFDLAQQSARLFAAQVMPQFQD